MAAISVLVRWLLLSIAFCMLPGNARAEDLAAP